VTLQTASGLQPEDLEQLSPAQLVRLADWTAHHTGRGHFIPAAIRRLPLDTRMALADSPALTQAWVERETHRARTDVTAFADGYGSVDPPRGPPLPFDLWPAQRDALDLIAGTSKVWCLKARRLGLTWLVLHYAYWLIAHAADTPGARVLVFCKNAADAGKLLDRVKLIHARQPTYLRQSPGKDSVTRFALPERGSEIVALPATEGAARQETATLVVLDEFAFARHGTSRAVWTAVQPTIEGGGQLVGISTGNGRTGDGATFARVWDDAVAGRTTITPLFLPWDARPDRTAEWREQQRADYLSDAEFNAEYPDTPDHALAGLSSVTVYPHDGINSAEQLGRRLDADTDLRHQLAAEGTEIGTDWGDFQTFTVYALPLPGGGVYIIDELAQGNAEPSRAATAILSRLPGPDLPDDTVCAASRADSAPAGTNATFARVLDETRRQRQGMPESHTRVPFSRYKEGGGERRGVNTVGYIRRLLELTARTDADTTDLSSLHSVIAISPRCELLIAQLRNLERDAATGKVRKPALDPGDLSRGDHGPDALVALLAPRAARWTAERGDPAASADTAAVPEGTVRRVT